MESQASTPVTAQPAATPEAGPDLSKMTGEEAVAYVEAQKAKGAVKRTSKTQSPAQSSAETIKEAAAEAKRKLKVDDQEIDEDEVIKVFKERKGHQQAANKTLQEGLKARKQAEEAIAMLRDPKQVLGVLKKLGHDPRALSESHLAEILTEEMMDPKDRMIKELQAKVQAEEAAKAAAKKAEEDRHIQTLKEKFAQDYTVQFTEALKETQVPATKHTVAEMAKYIARAAEMKFEMTAKEAAQLVREDIIQAQQRLIGDSDGEMLIKLLGEEVANKVRKWDTSRLKNPEPQRTGPLEQGPPRERRAPHKRMSSKEWREFNRR